uniref:uncharacterized protein LOC143311340 n=1 Tax=Arvicanthis niloticus TaxID=61156 RepID=UPI00402B1E14
MNVDVRTMIPTRARGLLGARVRSAVSGAARGSPTLGVPAATVHRPPGRDSSPPHLWGPGSGARAPAASCPPPPYLRGPGGVAKGRSRGPRDGAARRRRRLVSPGQSSAAVSGPQTPSGATGTAPLAAAKAATGPPPPPSLRLLLLLLLLLLTTEADLEGSRFSSREKILFASREITQARELEWKESVVAPPPKLRISFPSEEESHLRHMTREPQSTVGDDARTRQAEGPYGKLPAHLSL